MELPAEVIDLLKAVKESVGLDVDLASEEKCCQFCEQLTHISAGQWGKPGELPHLGNPDDPPLPRLADMLKYTPVVCASCVERIKSDSRLATAEEQARETELLAAAGMFGDLGPPSPPSEDEYSLQCALCLLGERSLTPAGDVNPFCEWHLLDNGEGQRDEDGNGDREWICGRCFDETLTPYHKLHPDQEYFTLERSWRWYRAEVGVHAEAAKEWAEQSCKVNRKLLVGHSSPLRHMHAMQHLSNWSTLIEEIELLKPTPRDTALHWAMVRQFERLCGTHLRLIKGGDHA